MTLEKIKNKLSSDNLINAYYDNGMYELEFDVDRQQIIIANIKSEDHPNAWVDEWYFDDDEIIEEIVKNAEENDIQILEEIR